ncbi:hypothetical protein AAHE18_05G120400 [Arachis hypogaea]
MSSIAFLAHSNFLTLHHPCIKTLKEWEFKGTEPLNSKRASWACSTLFPFINASMRAFNIADSCLTPNFPILRNTSMAYSGLPAFASLLITLTNVSEVTYPC